MLRQILGDQMKEYGSMVNYLKSLAYLKAKTKGCGTVVKHLKTRTRKLTFRVD